MAVKKIQRPKTVRGVASGDRLLRVLSAFHLGDGPLKLSELAERTGLIKSTILRLAFTLEERGFLVRLAEGTYQIGAELFRLNAVYQASLDLESHVIPVLEHLAKETGELATFFIKTGAKRLCLYRADTNHLLKVDIKAGDTRPMDEAATAQILRAFEKVNPEKEVPIALPTYSTGATDPFVASMAVPVIGTTPLILAAVGVHGPSNRLTRTRAREFGPTLLSAGMRLTKTFGGRYPYF